MKTSVCTIFNANIIFACRDNAHKTGFYFCVSCRILIDETRLLDGRIIRDTLMEKPEWIR
jgi:hypothetical protein